MAFTFIKWLSAILIFNYSFLSDKHPYFVSVTEIEHNAAEKILEVSVKIFTDDFEKTLRKQSPTAKIDLTNPTDKNVVNKLIKDYVVKNLLIKADDNATTLNFIGYEIEADAVISYYEVKNIAAVKKIDVSDKLLYEYKKEQFSVIHVKVGSNRKSIKLYNPVCDFKAEF